MFSKFLVKNAFGMQKFIRQNLERPVLNSSCNVFHVIHRNFQFTKDREDEMKEKCKKESQTTKICPQLEQWASLSDCEKGDYCEKFRTGKLNAPRKAQKKAPVKTDDC